MGAEWPERRRVVDRRERRDVKIDNPSVTFITSDKDWVAMSNGTLKGSWAFLTGRLKVHGPQSTAKKLDEIFP
ncbi:MAG: hypothetical protein DMF25_04540 [Verrucomicrobia bacterium]|nr:MAG: hypothetical protein DMF25_04540 [Verrucomicrobiota bacterium]